MKTVRAQMSLLCMTSTLVLYCKRSYGTITNTKFRGESTPSEENTHLMAVVGRRQLFALLPEPARFFAPLQAPQAMKRMLSSSSPAMNRGVMVMQRQSPTWLAERVRPCMASVRSFSDVSAAAKADTGPIKVPNVPPPGFVRSPSLITSLLCVVVATFQDTASTSCSLQFDESHGSLCLMLDFTTAKHCHAHAGLMVCRERFRVSRKPEAYARGCVAHPVLDDCDRHALDRCC